MKLKRVLLTTMPYEGDAIQWQSPDYYLPVTSKYVPLGLLSLRTNAKKDNNEIDILDARAKILSLEETIKQINDYNPDILGLSVMTFSAYQMKEILNKTKAPYKVVGGPHTTRYADVIMKQGADAVFRGVLADKEFADAIDRQPKGIINCYTTINEIEYPKREGLDNEFYFATGNLFKSNKRMSMFSGTGCPNRCKFCDVQVKKPTRKLPSKVIEEMAYLKSIGAGEVHVYEDNFNTDKKYLEEICSEFDKQKVKMQWHGRAQAKLDYDIAKNLKDHGLHRLGVGIESLHDPTLKFFRKPQTVNSIKRFMDNVNKAGIDIVGYFLIGAPTETEEYRKNLPKTIYNLGITRPLFSILQPFPDTEYYNDLIREGNFKKDYWKEYIENPTANYRLPFPYGENKWKEDAKLVSDAINYFENIRKEKNNG